MADRKIVDISPPQKKETVRAVEERPKIKISLPRISPPKIAAPAGRLKFLFLTFFLLASGGVWAYFSLGEAKIEIWPHLDSLTLETKIVADKSAQSLDVLQKIVPGFVFEETANLSGEFSASGKKTVEKKAEGTIRVYNNSSLSQTLIANTRFQPPLEKFEKSLGSQNNPWFRSKARIVVAPKGFQDVQAAADSPGEEYNIKPSKFSIPGLAGSNQYTLVFGESFQQFSGGEKKELPQVLNKDLVAAQESLFQRAEVEGKKALREKVPEDYLFLADASKAEPLRGFSSAKEGDEAEKFNYEVSVKSSVIVSQRRDLESLLKSLLSDRLPKGKEMDEASLKADYSLFSPLDKNLSRMALSSQASINVFSPPEEAFLKQGLLGKSLSEATSFLENQDGLEKIKIHLWPFWLRSVPKDAEKIKIELRLKEG